MKHALRNTVLTAGTAVALLVPAAPASAANVATFNGTATIGCFGCPGYGPAGNSATFTVSGLINGVTAVNAGGSATFTVGNASRRNCAVSSTATGMLTVAGVGSTGFTWTRTGAHAVVTTGWGTASVVFAITGPLTNPYPCGAAVTASFAGNLVSP